MFLTKGAGAAIITLGAAGALLHTASESTLVPAFKAGPVVETTGAGDAFNGGFAAALARGVAPGEAVRFGCAVAGISVTRKGTAPVDAQARRGRGAARGFVIARYTLIQIRQTPETGRA